MVSSWPRRESWQPSSRRPFLHPLSAMPAPSHTCGPLSSPADAGAASPQVIPYTTLEYVRGTRSYDNRTTTSTAASTSNSQVDGLDIYLGRTFNRMDARRYCSRPLI